MSEWWRGGVIYQIYPRSFQDDSGDGVGDLHGIIRRLDHAVSLGVDAIWLSPIFPSPMADMGYDVSDYRGIHPMFGSIEDFDQLVENAHDRGLKVIIDQVISHTSDQHPWFAESKHSTDNARADWYVWVDPNPDGSMPNNWTSVFGGPAWEWNSTRRQYYLHNFLTSQPDLNFHCVDVQDALLDVLRFWLERGVDGFRFDTVNYYFHDLDLRSNPATKRKTNRPAVNPYDMQEHLYDKNRPENLDFLKRVRTLLDEFGAMSVGEVGESDHAVEIMAAYTEGNERLHMAYSFEMLGDDFTPGHFRDCMQEFFEGAPHGWPCWSFSNHDVRRHVTRWSQSTADRGAVARQAAAMLLTFKGSVCLYQGEELGLPEAEITFEELTDPPGIRFWPEYKGRDGCRTPMPWEAEAPHAGFSEVKPWLPVKADHAALNVEAQNIDPDSTLNYYRALLKMRREMPALITGDITFFDTDEPVLAFSRTLGEDAVVCIFNMSADPRIVGVAGADQGDMVSLSEGARLRQDGLHLEGNGFAILTLKTDAKSANVTYAST